jgi:hypothetical protein
VHLISTFATTVTSSETESGLMCDVDDEALLVICMQLLVEVDDGTSGKIWHDCETKILIGAFCLCNPAFKLVSWGQ